MVSFWKIFLVDASQKTPFRHLKKWKLIFLYNKVENFIGQHRLPCQDAHVCTIWAHYHTLCHGCGHNIGHLPWKPWNFVHDSSFLRTLFENICNIPILLFFIETRSHKMTQCEGFTFFWFFLISYTRFKTRSERRAWPFLARVEILKKS